jgi:hypothetical protein
VTTEPDENARAGLCARCRSATRLVSGHGSVFWRCDRSFTDPGFARYPVLPVLRCPGYEPSPTTPPAD